MSSALAFIGLPASSRIAPRVDALFTTLLIVSAVIVLGLFLTNLMFLIRYRRGSNAPRPPVRIKTWKLEAGWISVTTMVFLGFFAWGAHVYLDMERPPANATDIDVVGRQWMWDVRHGNGRREFDTLHVPVGQPIRLRLTSEDVIHSFFVPAFRIKQDVVPGKRVDTWFEATEVGTFHLFCSQYCGTKHAGMVGEIIVQAPEDYAAWLAAGNTDGTGGDHGRRLFVRYGCSGCHAPSATARAPALAGIYGQRVPLAGGKFAQVDEAYLRDSILEPNKQIAAGYPAVMPSFKGVIPEADLLELLAYLKSLAAPEPAPPSTAPELKR